MSLRVDYSKVNESGVKAAIEHDGGYSIGIFMMVIGIPEIKNAETAKEVHKRMRFYNTLTGRRDIAIANSEGDELEPSVDWFKNLIGLRVNISPQTWTQFKNNMIQNWVRDYEYSLRKDS